VCPIFRELILLDYFNLCRTLGKHITPPGGVDLFLAFIHSEYIAESSRKFRYLDIASNSGIVSRELAKFNLHDRIECIDINDTVVDWGNQLCEEEGLSNISFKCINAYEVPYLKHSFDIVNLGVSLGFFLKHRSVVLNNIRKVLRPDGIVFVNNLYYKSEPPLELVRSVQSILGTDIVNPEKMNYEFHLSYLSELFELKSEILVSYEGRQSKSDHYHYIKDYCSKNKSMVIEFDDQERESLYHEYARQREILNENDLYCGSAIQAWTVK